MNTSSKMLIQRRFMSSVQELDTKIITSVFGEGVVKKAYVTNRVKKKSGQIDCGDPPGTSLGIEFENGNVIVIYNSEWMTVEKISK